jgi:hypothetical protein
MLTEGYTILTIFFIIHILKWTKIIILVASYMTPLCIYAFFIRESFSNTKKINMKTCTITFLGAVLLSLTSYAQNDQFKKGQADVQLGIGFLSTLNHTFKTAGYTTKQIVLPISVAAEYAVTDEVSAGVAIAYAKTHLEYQGFDLGTVSHVIIGVRGLYHFHLLSSLDTYGGAMLGYNSTTFSDNADKVKVSVLAYTFMVGGKYYFTKNAAVFLELGYGVASVNLGLNFKLSK